MGCFVEALEPQLRDAVMNLRGKGYNTQSSGFSAGITETTDGQHLAVELDTSLDPEIEADLARQNFSVTYYPDEDNKHGASAIIKFYPVDPTDLGALKTQWDTLASILPDLGHLSPPTDIRFATLFREQVAAGRLHQYVEQWEYGPDPFNRIAVHYDERGERRDRNIQID